MKCQKFPSPTRRLFEDSDGSENARAIRLAYLPVRNHLVENHVRAIDVEHDVELANVLEILIERFDDVVYEFQDGELVLFAVDAEDEVERRVLAIDDLHVAIFHVGALALVSGETFAYDFGFGRHSLVESHVLVVLGESRLALLVDQKEKFDGHRGTRGGGGDLDPTRAAV